LVQAFERDPRLLVKLLILLNLITYAISIRQPYIELILQGKKLKEFRTRRTLIRGRVYLYSSKTPKDDPSAWRKCEKLPGSLATGEIVGTVDIVECGPTADGGYAYKLANPRRLRRHLHPTNQPLPSFWIPQF
jgi:hypothetical protein